MFRCTTVFTFSANLEFEEENAAGILTFATQSTFCLECVTNSIDLLLA